MTLYANNIQVTHNEYSLNNLFNKYIEQKDTRLSFKINKPFTVFSLLHYIIKSYLLFPLILYLFIEIIMIIISHKLKTNYIDHYMSKIFKDDRSMMLIVYAILSYILWQFIYNYVDSYFMNRLLQHSTNIFMNSMFDILSNINISTISNDNIKIYNLYQNINDVNSIIKNFKRIIISIFIILMTMLDIYYNTKSIMLIIWFIVIIIGNIVLILYCVYKTSHIFELKSNSKYNKYLSECNSNYEIIYYYNLHSLAKQQLLEKYNHMIKDDNYISITKKHINFGISVCITSLVIILVYFYSKDISKQKNIKNKITSIFMGASSIASMILRTIYISKSNDMKDFNTIITAYHTKKPNICLQNNINKIVVNDLNYYINDKCILSNINLELQKGDKVLFYGPSGCGKSTLMKILMNMYDKYSGDIYINDVNLRDIQTKSYVNKLSIISQDNYIFNDTVQNNIWHGDITQNIKDTKNIIKQLDLHKIQHRCGINGKNLSGGQKRRVCVGRGLFGYKSGNLVFTDESFANLNKLNIAKMINVMNSIISSESISIYIEHTLDLLPYVNKIIAFMPGDNNSYTCICMNSNEFKEYINNQMI